MARIVAIPLRILRATGVGRLLSDAPLPSPPQISEALRVVPGGGLALEASACRSKSGRPSWSANTHFPVQNEVLGWKLRDGGDDLRKPARGVGALRVRNRTPERPCGQAVNVVLELGDPARGGEGRGRLGNQGCEAGKIGAHDLWTVGLCQVLAHALRVDRQVRSFPVGSPLPSPAGRGCRRHHPPTRRGPWSDGLTTTISACAGAMPVRSRMLTWWITRMRLPPPTGCARRAFTSASLSFEARVVSLKLELSAGHAVAWPKARVAVAMQRHHWLESTSLTGVPRARKATPRECASARPASERLRCVAQSSSLKPGGSPMPGTRSRRGG